MATPCILPRNLKPLMKKNYPPRTWKTVKKHPIPPKPTKPKKKIDFWGVLWNACLAVNPNTPSNKQVKTLTPLGQGLDTWALLTRARQGTAVVLYQYSRADASSQYNSLQVSCFSEDYRVWVVSCLHGIHPRLHQVFCHSLGLF